LLRVKTPIQDFAADLRDESMNTSSNASGMEQEPWRLDPATCPKTIDLDLFEEAMECLEGTHRSGTQPMLGSQVSEPPTFGTPDFGAIGIGFSRLQVPLCRLCQCLVLLLERIQLLFGALLQIHQGVVSALGCPDQFV